MNVLIEQTSYEVLPVGEYPARISEIEAEDGMFGPQVKFTFTIEQDDYEDQVVWGWTSARFSPKSKLYQWAKSAFNAPIPTDYNFNSNDLIDRPVMLVVVVKTKDDGSEFNKIDSVRPYQQTKNDASEQIPVTSFPPKSENSSSLF